jgi:hypothetical protein
MASLRRWAPRAIGAVCCALVGAVWVPGTAGAVAGQKWAVVSASGTLVRGHGVVSATRALAGVYDVNFDADMTGCTYQATPGDPASTPVVGPVQMTVTLGTTAARLHVKTFDQTIGAVADAPFHLTTYCGPNVNAAVIAADGSTVRGSHVTGSTHFDSGTYGVFFDHDVSKCTFTATSSVSNVPGPISVGGLFTDPNGVFVHTLSRASIEVDVPFHLAVDCGVRRLTAVIKASGSKARGAHVTSSAKTAPGKYDVVFDRDVSSCAYTATVGEPGNTGQISDPVVITTASLLGNVNGVSLAVRNVDGHPQNEPFHLKVTC